MQQYILKRVLALFSVLFLATFTVFFVLRLLAPQDIVSQMLAESPGANDPAIREQLRREFGIDQPPHVQYVQWLWGALHGDLGTSWSTGRPVTLELGQRLPVTLELAFFTSILSVLIGIPLGVISAVRRDSWVDYGARFVAVLGLSVPNFVLAIGLLFVASVVWHWTPPPPYVTPWQNLGNHTQHMLLPLLSLSAVVGATKVRLLRSLMLEVLRTDYVRTARAKGLAERIVIYRHALKNALIPIVTVLGTQVSATLGGTVIIEQIYTLPGLGSLTYSSIILGDFPQLQGSILYLLVIFLVMNLVVDVSYGWLDPRIRYQ